MGLKCGLLNVQSVCNKALEMRDLICEEGFDILMLTETWLGVHSEAVIAELTPVTHVFHHIHREERRGGGVGIVISNVCKGIKVHRGPSYVSFEHIHVSCEIQGRKCAFIIIYRPPEGRVNIFNDEFRLYLETIDMVSINTYICGDFNLWIDDLGARGVEDFYEIMEYFDLENSVGSATSVSGHILDLVVTGKDSGLVLNLEVEEVCTLSPVHKLISFNIPFWCTKKQIERITFRLKNVFEPEVLLTEIEREMIQKFADSCDHGGLLRNCTSCGFSVFNNMVRSKYDEMCPKITKEIVVIDRAPWYNYEIDRAKREKRRCERLWRRHKTWEYRRDYQIARNNERSVIRRRKCEYYRKKTNDAGNNIHKLYKILHGLTGNKKKNRLPEGFSDDILANMFLEFFDNKIQNIVESFGVTELWRPLMPPPRLKLRSFRLIDGGVVRSIIKRVKYTYCDSDPIPVAEIVGCDKFGVIIDFWTNMMNTSIENKVFPDSEKRAIVKPIVKGNLDGQSLSSFRPVSNLTFISKIMENIILDQLLEHMQAVDALPDEQSAYRRLYSTETVMCSVVNDLLSTLDDGKCAILILLDLSAAFDTVVHDMLLNDCHNIGIEDEALQYLKSYLEGRTYCVQIGQSFSETRNLERGVPQGSVLGPVLFCIYTIELSYLLKSHGVRFKLFADDTQFYLSLENVGDTKQKIERIMSDIGKWMNSKQLKLNEDKTECLIVGRPSEVRRMNIKKMSINGVEVDVKDEVKNLGVMMDSSLSFKKHISLTVKTAGYHLKNIAYVRRYLDLETTKKLVHNYVISKLDYCNIIYYGLPKYLLRKLQLVMNRAARLVTGTSPRERITPVLIKLHWLPIKARIAFKILTTVYLALKFERPLYVRDMLHVFHIDSSMTLRHGVELHRLSEPRYSTELGHRAFGKSAPRLYNKLPIEIKAAETIEIFKSKLKTFLFADCYDLVSGSVNEQHRV